MSRAFRTGVRDLLLSTPHRLIPVGKQGLTGIMTTTTSFLWRTALTLSITTARALCYQPITVYRLHWQCFMFGNADIGPVAKAVSPSY
jgi:hypothetical protein